MIKSNKIEGIEATEGLMRGVACAVDLIRPTYGGSGTNVIVEEKVRPLHGVYNDAWSIIKNLKAEGHAERIGLDFVKELCERADKLSGDARKTTCILLDEILKAGYEADINKLQLKRELDAMIPFIECETDKQTKQITVDEVSSVATTASESVEIGNLLQEIYQKIGKNGIIHPQGSGTYETSYDFIDGVRFDGTGFLSPFMVHDKQAQEDKVQETKAVYENPNILVTKKKILNIDEIYPILKGLNEREKRNLIIFTQDMDTIAASYLINVQQAGGYKDSFGGFHSMNVLIIKAPVLWQNYVFEDFAKCTGATIVEDATGVNFKNLDLKHLGTCDKIIVDAEETIVIGTKDISEHIQSLKQKGDADSNLRLSWLATKSVILKIGANSETDLSYKRLKVQDAIRSSQLALKYGVVKGGGHCLSEVQPSLPQTTAGDVLSKALLAPYNQIYQNSGTNELPDGIVDSAQTIKNAVRNAIGIASTILTANGLIYIPEPTSQEIAYAIATNNNQSF